MESLGFVNTNDSIGKELMALDYEVKFRWTKLFPVLDEHTAWFHDFLNLVFYSDFNSAQEPLSRPVSFLEWLETAKKDEGIQAEVVDQLIRLHSDLFSHADSLLKIVQQTKAKPDNKSFQEFMTIYEEFVLSLRRLESDFMLEDSGYDPFTGLRSPANLFSDIDREMQRLCRQGRSFCLAIARIDNFSAIEKSYSQSEKNAFIKLVSDLVKLSIRTFDDAYHVGKGEFVLSLKQADIKGGFSALERLRRELELQSITLEIENQKRLLSMSCCIAEPVYGDDIQDLLNNLRTGLNNTDKKTDRVLEYFELSPLQRYIQETARH